MPDVWLDTLHEINASSATLDGIHPLKLDRWHRTLFELPDVLYMQLSCSELLTQVRQAATGLATVLDVLGTTGLPVTAAEIAQRHIGTFSWHMSANFEDSGTILFTATWDKSKLFWRLSCAKNMKEIKLVPDVGTAVEKAKSWVGELDPRRPGDPEPEDTPSGISTDL